MFDERERAMILAGLAMADVGLPSIFLGIASDGGRLEPLGSAEIINLMARIQHGPLVVENDTPEQYRPACASVSIPADQMAIATSAPEDELFSGHFRNSYSCPCGENWEEEADSMCDDRCPSCNTAISPHHSEDLTTETENDE